MSTRGYLQETTSTLAVILLAVEAALLAIQPLSVKAGERSSQDDRPIVLADSKGARQSMTLTSPAFRPNESIPSKYTCDGPNVSPPLVWFGVPEGTRSLALVMDDPDAPDGMFTHWLIWNIPKNVHGFTENYVKPDPATSGIIVGRTTDQKNGYTGPCPPSGTHRYQFHLYALDSQLDVKEGADKKAIEQAMQGHVLERADLAGLYGHQTAGLMP